MKFFRCAFRGFVWTTIYAPLWRVPRAYFSGHIWPDEPAWGSPEPSRFPDDWPGLVEYDESRCVECGYQPRTMWRRWYGAA